MQVFFPGAYYNFYDNVDPALCWVNNFMAIGTSIILDPREPDDDPKFPYRMLRFLPLAVTVRPEGTSLGVVSKHVNVPEHSVTVPLKHLGKNFKIQLPERIRLYRDSIETGTLVNVKRKGIALQSGFVVTDFYAEVCLVAGSWFLVPGSWSLFGTFISPTP